MARGQALVEAAFVVVVLTMLMVVSTLGLMGLNVPAQWGGPGASPAALAAETSSTRAAMSRPPSATPKMHACCGAWRTRAIFRR